MKICLYNTYIVPFPTFSISSDIHADWVLIFHFYSQHRVFCSENRADLLWNYFSVPVFQAPEKTIRSKPFVSFHIIFYPRKVIAFYNQNDSHTDYVISRLPSHITCMSVIAYCSTWQEFTYRMRIQCFYRHYNRQITVAFTLQIVNLTTRTVEQYNDTPKDDMSSSW